MSELRRLKTRLQLKETEQLADQRKNIIRAKQGPVLSFEEIQANAEKVKRMNEANFTAPGVIERAKAINETTFKIAAYTKGTKIWVPNRVKFGKQLKRSLEQQGEKT